MRTFLKGAVASLALLWSAGVALAEGELQLYNWGDYTSPELLKKFEEVHKVKVTVTDYDSNDTALAKVRAGGHGFDLVVPSANYVPVWISEGLVVEPGIPQMENFKNIDPKWVDVAYDPGRKFSVPWLWGLTGVAVNTKVYGGDVNTSAIFLDPPAELVGKINVAPEMNDVMFAAIKYFGGERCTDNKDVLVKVRDKLKEAKPKWLAMDYSAHEKMASREYSAVFYWNGAMLRARLQNDEVKFGYPKEGFALFMDNVMLLKDAKNADNAKLFLNFIMAPENAAMLSNFAKYANGITGSEAFMDKNLQGAPELTIPAELADKGEFLLACPPAVNDLYTKIWTDVLK
jgi:spermidine/putrescine transport system substrate-binding protein